MPSPVRDNLERAQRVARLIRLVEKIVAESGNLDNFDAAGWTARWLERPNAALGGLLPAEVMQTEEGLQVVESILARMQSGAYS